MIKISSQEIQKLAKTSRIALDDAEVGQLATEIEAVLEYASTLAEVAKEDRPKANRIHEGNVVREDIPVVCDPEPILALAPEREGDYFVVPRIIKQS